MSESLHYLADDKMWPLPEIKEAITERMATITSGYLTIFEQDDIEHEIDLLTFEEFCRETALRAFRRALNIKDE